MKPAYFWDSPPPTHTICKYFGSTKNVLTHERLNSFHRSVNEKVNVTNEQLSTHCLLAELFTDTTISRAAGCLHLKRVMR